MKKIYLLACIVTALFCFSACDKEEMVVVTIPTTTVTLSGSGAEVSAQLKYTPSNASYNGMPTIQHYGAYVSATDPTVKTGRTRFVVSNSQSGLSSFTVTLSGLAPDTEYYIRAFISNMYGEILGDVVTVTTYSGVKLTTDPATEITANSAKLSGSVTAKGEGTNFKITQQGFVLSTTNSSPTLENNTKQVTTVFSGTGTFTYNCTGLTSGTRYYYRAYATVNGETLYAMSQSFTTIAADDKVIMELEEVNSNTIYATNVVLHGTINIGKDAMGTFDEIGFVYSTAPTPTINNSKFYWSSTNTPWEDEYGAFDTWVGSKRLDGIASPLNAGTKYYYRMYYKQKGSSSVVYSDTKTFTTAGGTGTDGGTVTIAQFKNKPDDVNTWYTVSGVIYNIYSSQYGNLYLADETGLLAVYGVTATRQTSGRNDQSFASLGLQVGDYITIKAPKITYNGIPEAKNGYLVSKSSTVPSFTTFALEPTTTSNFTFNTVTSVTAKIYNYEGGYEGDDWQQTDISLVNSGNMSLFLRYYSYGTIDATLGIVPGTYSVKNTSNYYIPWVMWQSRGYSANTNTESGCTFYRLGAFSDYAPYYIKSGSVTIAKVGTKARITFDLTSYYGSSITGDVTVDIKSNLTTY